MTYVLIIMAWMGGYVSGPIVTTQEFTGLEQCEVARRQLGSAYEAWGSGDKLKLLCVPR